LLRAYIGHKFAFDMSGEVLPFLDSAVVPFKAAAAEDWDRNGLFDVVVGKSIDWDDQKEKDEGAGQDDHTVIGIELG
jgi:hypothetical protein